MMSSIPQVVKHYPGDGPLTRRVTTGFNRSIHKIRQFILNNPPVVFLGGFSVGATVGFFAGLQTGILIGLAIGKFFVFFK